MSSTYWDRASFDELPLPVSFRSFDIGMGFMEYSTCLVSFDRDGLVITSPRKLRCGSLLSIKMRMPPEILGGLFWHCRCTGRVVAERLLSDGDLTYKVELETSSLPS